MRKAASPTPVQIPPEGLLADLRTPASPDGLIIFAHGMGSGRHSTRNRMVAERFAVSDHASLLLDLLTPEESRDAVSVFDIERLADRLSQAVDWALSDERTADLPIALFGASTGAAAALKVASRRRSAIRAVVSRGGRTDLAAREITDVLCPVLMIVGEADTPVIEWNRESARRLGGRAIVSVIRGAGHLFEEPGALDGVVRKADPFLTRVFADAGLASAQPS